MLTRRMLITVLVLTLAGCGSSDSSVVVDASYHPGLSLSGAVQTLLDAEQRNDRAASFAVLAPSARTEYKDVADWTARRDQLPAITSYELQRTEKTKQTVLVHHRPALDPFKGLAAASETQTWTGTKVKGGWLLAPDPQVDYVLPSNESASAAVTQWAQAVQACDQNVARSLQAIEPLLASDAVPTLCKASGPVTTGTVGRLPEGPQSSTYVDQYSTDALAWARTVPLTSPVRVTVVVAPLGDNWRVIGLY